MKCLTRKLRLLKVVEYLLQEMIQKIKINCLALVIWSKKKGELRWNQIILLHGHFFSGFIIFKAIFKNKINYYSTIYFSFILQPLFCNSFTMILLQVRTYHGDLILKKQPKSSMEKYLKSFHFFKKTMLLSDSRPLLL